MREDWGYGDERLVFSLYRLRGGEVVKVSVSLTNAQRKEVVISNCNKLQLPMRRLGRKLFESGRYGYGYGYGYALLERV
jgi:hypothetical protein